MSKTSGMTGCEATCAIEQEESFLILHHSSLSPLFFLSHDVVDVLVRMEMVRNGDGVRDKGNIPEKRKWNLFDFSYIHSMWYDKGVCQISKIVCVKYL